jgi:hypothetical protein
VAGQPISGKQNGNESIILVPKIVVCALQRDGPGDFRDVRRLTNQVKWYQKWRNSITGLAELASGFEGGSQWR